MSGPGDPDLITLAQAQQWLREVVDEGAVCPCCTQFAKVYRRKLTKASARSVIALYRASGLDWCHLPSVVKRRLSDVAHQGGYMTLAGYWGLIEEERALRDDGGRAGYWRVTSDGYRFIVGEISIPKYVRLYDGRRLSLIGEPLTIHDVLGERFDFRELMEGI